MSFRPPLWASLLTITTVALFSMLSWWQYQRGQAKADIIARQGDTAQAVTVINDTGIIPTHGRRIEARGHWLAEQEVLLDNQTREQRVGVRVWTALALSGSGHIILVDRGWLQASLRRDQLPDTGTLPSDEVVVRGYWRSLPQAGLATDDGTCQADQQHWPARLNYPSYALLDCLYQQPVANGLVLLDPQAENGFKRAWNDLGVPPQRHYGYAFQWAAMALTVFILYLFLNFRRTSQ